MGRAVCNTWTEVTLSRDSSGALLAWECGACSAQDSLHRQNPAITLKGFLISWRALLSELVR